MARQTRQFIRLDAFAPVAHLDHQNNLMHHPRARSRLRKRRHDIRIGIQAGAAGPHDPVGLAAHGRADQDNRRVNARSPHPFHIGNPRIRQTLHATVKHGLRDFRMTAHAFGHACHRNPVLRKAVDKLPRIPPDLDQINLDAWGGHCAARSRDPFRAG